MHRITRQQVKDWLEWYDFAHDRDFAAELFLCVNSMENEYIPIEIERRKAAKQSAERASLRDGKRGNRK